MDSLPPWLQTRRGGSRRQKKTEIDSPGGDSSDVPEAGYHLGGEAPLTVDADTDHVTDVEECSICCDLLEGADCRSRTLACGHIFHHTCIQEWLIRRPLCPICKRPANAAASNMDEVDNSNVAWLQERQIMDADVSVEICDRAGGDGAGGGAVVDCRFALAVGSIPLIPTSRLLLLRRERYGLVGRNGAGKSLLLSQLASGDLPRAESTRVALVAQEELPTGETVLERILSGDERRTLLLAELESLEAVIDPGAEVADRVGLITEELQSIGAHEAESRAAALALNLGFGEQQLRRPIRQLSGGWRMRVSLARALFAEPDLLLLDEATNHLDLEAALWLQRWLTAFQATVVLVSHDAHFLDGVVTHVIHLGPDGLHLEKGNYTTFEEHAEQHRIHHEHLLEKRRVNEERVRKSIEESTRRGKVAGDENAARAAKTRLDKKLQRIGLHCRDGKRYKLSSLRRMHEKWVRLPERVEALQTDAKLRFRLPAVDHPPGASQELLSLRSASFSFPSQAPSNDSAAENRSTVLQGVTLCIRGGTRAAVVGRNGNGKSTLLRLLANELEPSEAGARIQRPHAVIAYVSQHHLEALEDFLSLSPVEYLRLRKGYLLRNDREARQYLGRFGLPGRLALTPLGALSGGLRTRLAFAEALLLPSPPTLLLLDEPTNHLDFESIEALSLGLELFEGAVAVVSHNVSFLATVCEELWIVRDGAVEVCRSTEGGDGFPELFQCYSATVEKDSELFRHRGGTRRIVAAQSRETHSSAAY